MLGGNILLLFEGEALQKRKESW